MSLPWVKVANAPAAPEPAGAGPTCEDEHGVSEACQAIDMDAFRNEVAAWKRRTDETPQGAPQPPPSLTLTQREFARLHLAVQRSLAIGRQRGEDPKTPSTACARGDIGRGTCFRGLAVSARACFSGR